MHVQALRHGHAGPYADKHHRQSQGGIGTQQNTRKQRCDPPHQKRVGRISVDMIHLADEHDARTEHRQCKKDRRIGERGVSS